MPEPVDNDIVWKMTPEWLKEMITALREGCTEDVFATFVCNECGAALELDLHPDLTAFSLYCPKSTEHLCASEDIEDPPEWMKARIGGDWLD